ncbi:PAQR family membrane homeostasis protein TrhA [Aeromicrobium chenweiae]|uniref:DNA-binding protein n=1 Tax=Aeromicrobium chenweiae TaxID=2079793 RepID=A0A2S0WP96_9ACTN|nr:hemolysin III family protein [Aeromicrobium chenweiae]AWB93100.1 DNA-binding protein [Aeromicrobium chenweiae]TGN34088.1 hemolysin III family protein [Aeromicrobium chenweiae]
MIDKEQESAVQEATDRFRDTVDEMKPKLRGWLHAVTLPLAFFAFIVMLVIADDIWVRIGVAVFMVSSMLLFGVSAVYHRGTWSDRVRGFWKRFDHANIFLLIAGSYTPFSLLLLSRDHWIIMLSLVWGGALLGVVFKLFWIDAPRWLYVPLYLVLGWAAVLYFPEFVENSSTAVMVMLVGGGVLYTLGAIVYGFKWPNPSPRYFGFHEVFHAFTIAAFIVHYIGVSLLAYQQH